MLQTWRGDRREEERGASPSFGAKGGNILLKLYPENRVNSLVLHTNSHLAVGPNICSESRSACSIWDFHPEKLKGYNVDSV